jgi:hypothetical protein
VNGLVKSVGRIQIMTLQLISWDEGVIRVWATKFVPPLTLAEVQANVYTEGNIRQGTDSECLGQVAAPGHLLIRVN